MKNDSFKGSLGDALVFQAAFLMSFYDLVKNGAAAHTLWAFYYRLGPIKKRHTPLASVTFLAGVFREFFICFFAGTQTSLSNIRFSD